MYEITEGTYSWEVSEAELFRMVERHKGYCDVTFFNNNKDVTISFKDKLYIASEVSHESSKVQD